jgi:nucleotide-binding universal stress UspA family protein
MKLERILVGIDFSKESEVAHVQAAELGARHGAEVRLLHAFVDGDFWPAREFLFGDSAAEYDEMVEGEIKSRRARLAALEVNRQFPRLVTSSFLEEGEPDTVIPQQAEAWGADLVVVGTHGRTGFKRLRLGSVAERTIRRTPCSVLVARPRTRPGSGYHRILVPIDFSDGAERALSAAVDLVDHDGQIDVLHTWQIPFASSARFNEYESSAVHRKRLVAATLQRGDELVKGYEDRHSRLAFFQIESAPVPGILDRLEDATYDLVVMGSHGRRGVRRWVLGSVAEATARHSLCSVMVVR